MARIQNPQITAQIAELAAQDSVDTNELVALINEALPPGQQIQQATGLTTGMYKEFTDFDKIDARTEVVTSAMWTGDESTIDVGSPSTSGLGIPYYTEITISDEPQFSVAYGHIEGYGSFELITDNEQLDGILSTQIIYNQFRSMLLPSTQEKFVIGGAEVDDIYVININRTRYREKVDPGNWEIVIDGKTYIDDSGKTLGPEYGTVSRVYNIIDKDDVEDPSPEIVGLFYPDRGIMIFKPDSGNIPGGSDNFSTAGSQGDHDQQYNTFLSDIGNFTARRVENIATQHFFVRATNREYNYSNNPTFVDENGRFKNLSFETDPKTYITTIGLYNRSNEMVAVAKTSQPIEKSFSRETLIKVRLAF